MAETAVFQGGTDPTERLLRVLARLEVIRQQAAVAAAPPSRPAGVPAWTESVDA